MPEIEFFYDVASPYSYLAAARIERVAGAAGVPVRWRPFLLGGVFKASGNDMPAAVAVRGRYMLKDLQRGAEREGTPFRFDPSFPTNSLRVMRILAAAEGTPALVPLTHAFFRALWVDGRDLKDDGVVRELLGEHADLLDAASTPEVKDRLRATTDEAVARGAFGAPTLLVGDELFFGNDRLDWAVDYASSLGKSDRS